MRKVTLRHQVVCLDDAVDVSAMNTDGDTHNHVLRSLSNSTIDSEKVRTFEGFEAETS